MVTRWLNEGDADMYLRNYLRFYKFPASHEVTAEGLKTYTMAKNALANPHRVAFVAQLRDSVTRALEKR